MFPSIFHLYVLKDIEQSRKKYNINVLIEENKNLKKENKELKDKLYWVILSKNEIYDNYIKNIIKYSK
tara:strand:+ start:289 stop:492 length:204 start_codon:yes stop_codon:yes gene_type:complete